MDPTRRALCGFGITGVPLVVLGRPVFSAGQQPAGTPDSFLSYLIEDTKRNCRLAGRPGRERAKHVRRLGANAEVLTAYLLSQPAADHVKATFQRRVSEDGADAMASRVRQRWPELASSLSAEFGVAVPPDLDHAAVTTAIGRLQRYGCPRLGGIRDWFEREAVRIEQWEGRTGAPVVVRQVPGSDYGPAGWSAGVGEGDLEMSCYEMGILLAALGVLAEFVPEWGPVLRPLLPILSLVLAVACGG